MFWFSLSLQYLLQWIVMCSIVIIVLQLSSMGIFVSVSQYLFVNLLCPILNPVIVVCSILLHGIFCRVICYLISLNLLVLVVRFYLTSNYWKKILCAGSICSSEMASSAVSSACSFRIMPQWDGIHMSEILLPCIHVIYIWFFVDFFDFVLEWHFLYVL